MAPSLVLHLCLIPQPSLCHDAIESAMSNLSPDYLQVLLLEYGRFEMVVSNSAKEWPVVEGLESVEKERVDISDHSVAITVLAWPRAF